MKWIAVLAAVFTSVSFAVGPAHAESSSSATVKRYFDALGKNDFKRALALTAGAAQERTARMVGTLQKQAHDHDAGVTLRVRALLVTERPAAALAAGPIPVDVTFDIDVVGHKWIFSKVARKLAGKAQFFLAPDDDQHIVAIEGNLQ